jgi:outer membrane protein assembly factor BamB
VTRALRLLIALVLLAGAGVVVWRVLAPTEVVDPARDAYPPAVAPPPGVTGETAGAPLIVEGRIRVFAAKRQVSADAPVAAKTSYTPRWSYRRWPAQLNGVVAVGRTVISRWSDGELVAIDGATGRVAWRANGPPAPGYTGLSTGAATVWAPPGLVTAGPIVLAGGAAFDAATGAPRWRAGCPDGFGTTGGAYVCGGAAYAAQTGARLTGWPAGPLTPLDCGVARSGCGGFRTGTSEVWLASGPRPLRVRGPLLAAGLSVQIDGGSVTASTSGTARRWWRWSAPAGQTVRLLGSSGGRVYLLTSVRELVAVEAATGVVRSAFRLAVGTEKATWTPGLWQIAGGYVAVERLDDPDPASVHHYFTVATVVIAAA